MTRHIRFPRAFTLVEALMAMSITVVAGGAILFGMASTVDITDDSLQRTIARGIAEQLMEEMAGCFYYEPGGSPTQYPLGPAGSEVSGASRQLFDDIGDFHALTQQPPRDSYGMMLGQENGTGGLRQEAFRVRDGYFDNWRTTVNVYYVSSSTPGTPLAAGQTSNYRLVQVHVYVDQPEGATRELALLSRVFAYVPLPS